MLVLPNTNRFTAAAKTFFNVFIYDFVSSSLKLGDYSGSASQLLCWYAHGTGKLENPSLSVNLITNNYSFRYSSRFVDMRTTILNVNSNFE